MSTLVAHTSFEDWERAIAFPVLRHPLLVAGPRVARPYDVLLQGTVLDPRDRSADAGARGSTLEDGDLGRAAGGRPRTGSRKRAYNRKRIYGRVSNFDSIYAYHGEQA